MAVTVTASLPVSKYGDVSATGCFSRYYHHTVCYYQKTAHSYITLRSTTRRLTITSTTSCNTLPFNSLRFYALPSQYHNRMAISSPSSHPHSLKLSFNQLYFFSSNSKACCKSFKQAVNSCHIDCLKGLLKGTKHPDGYAAIHVATVLNNLPCVSRLLLHGEDPNECNHLGVTSVHLAAEQGNVEILLALLKAGAHPSPTDCQNCTPLHYAAQADPPLKTSHALAALYKFHEKYKDKYGPLNLDCANSDGFAPLHMVVETKGVVFASALLKLRANVNVPAEKNGMTPLHRAAVRGRIEMADLLLNQKNIVINCVDGEGMTPMHHAALHGNIEMMKFLYSRGAAIDVIDDKKTTPLTCSVQEGFLEGVDFCLSKKAHFEHAAIDGHRPIHFAALLEDPSLSFSIVTSLVNAGAKVNSICEAGATPLIYAVQSRKVDVIQLLLSHSADTNIWDDHGMTALHYAALHGDIHLIHLLLEAGAKINTRSPHGETPLFIALTGDHQDAARYLLLKGADPMQPNDEGYTILHVLATNEKDSTDLLRSLLLKGVNPSCRSNDGSTPLMMAQEAGNENISKLLASFGAT